MFWFFFKNQPRGIIEGFYWIGFLPLTATCCANHLYVIASQMAPLCLCWKWKKLILSCCNRGLLFSGSSFHLESLHGHCFDFSFSLTILPCSCHMMPGIKNWLVHRSQNIIILCKKWGFLPCTCTKFPLTAEINKSHRSCGFPHSVIISLHYKHWQECNCTLSYLNFTPADNADIAYMRGNNSFLFAFLCPVFSPLNGPATSRTKSKY